MRVILLVHRYLGVVLGLVMTMWCLSGFVMMYQGYPRLEEAARLAGLEPLNLSACCRLGPDTPDPVSAFRMEMLGGRPILHLRSGFAPERLVDLSSGAAQGPISALKALEAAAMFANGNALAGSPMGVSLIDKDQWTVEGAGRRGPVYRIPLSDRAATVLYVSARSGQVVQRTSAATRFWGWLGAVPHWLYPTLLRQDGALWSQVVIWTSLAGCFLTLTGLFVGISRFRRYKGGRWSPYRGWLYWHHILGLVFGVLTLSWVASGLFSMNPWGFLDTPVGLAERARLAGDLKPEALTRILAWAPSRLRSNAVALEGAPLAGRPFVAETGWNGGTRRLDGDGRPAPLRRPELLQALQRSGLPAAELSLLSREDADYYSGYQHPVRLPVWRARLTPAAGGATLYLDAETGALVDAYDATARTSRWLRTGLHDLDFPVFRRRPFWDVAVMLLLGGVTAGCATGAWLGLRRAIHDLSGLRRALARQAGQERT